MFICEKKPVKNWPQNAVNVDTLTDDMLPSQSQVCDHFHSEIEQVYIQIHGSLSVHLILDAMTFIPQTDFVGIQGILETGDLGAAPSPQALAPITSQDLAMAQMYQRDSSLCLQKWGKEKTTLVYVQDII